MSDPNDKQKCGGTKLMMLVGNWGPLGTSTRIIDCPGCAACAPRADGSAAEVKRYRLSYRHGVIADDGSANYLADASEPMVLASAYDAMLAKQNADFNAISRTAEMFCKERDSLASRVAELERLLRRADYYVVKHGTPGAFELRDDIRAALSKGAQT